MSKWIQTTMTAYNLDKTTEIKIKGDVKSYQIWKGTYKYRIEIVGNGHRVTLAEDVAAGAFRNSNDTLTINIEKKRNEIAKCATAKGQSCYIVATGTAGDSTVEYLSYITLSAPSLAMEDGILFEIEAVNNIDALGNIPVTGFSKLKARLSGINLTYGARITKILFSGNLFDDITYSDDSSDADKSTQEFTTKDKLKIFGDITVRCTVVNSFGYSVTKEVTLNIRNYGSPNIRFIKGPFRTKKEKTELPKSEAKKGRTYGLYFETEITPFAIYDDEGKNINTIIPYNESEGQKCYVEIANPKDKTWNYFTSSSDTLASINNETGVLTTSYNSYNEDGNSEWPQLANDSNVITEKGLAINRAYILTFTVVDITGTQHVFKKRIPSITTTVHLRRGGGGVSFGGYSTKENTFESEYQILCNELIEAVGDDAVKKSGGKGTVKGKFLIAGSSFKLGDTEVTGFGTGENHIAKGDHSHGDILADGMTKEASRVLISNENKEIEAAKVLPIKNLKMETDGTKILSDNGFLKDDTNCPSIEEILKSFNENPVGNYGIQIESGSPGTDKSGLCYADHQHPYTREWINDPLFVKIIQSLMMAVTGYV